MKTLEEILGEYFACHKVFKKKNGNFTKKGDDAYFKLTNLLGDLEKLGLPIDTEKCMKELDKITNENY